MPANTLEEIYKASAKFLKPLTLEETYSTIVHEAQKLVQAQFGSLVLYRNREFQREYSTLPEGMELSIRKNGNTHRAFNEKKAFVVHAREFAKRHLPVGELGVKSIIFIPLTDHNKSIGVLIMHSHQDEPFEKADLDVLKLFGSQASLAIRKAQLYDETRKSLASRDLFIAMASHEFRTPLTTISGYAELLHKRFNQKNTQESEWIHELVRESRRLTQLVKELLEINQINSGTLKYQFEKANIKLILSRVLINFTFSQPNRELIIEDKLEEGKDVVIGDFDKLIQVIDNMLENAAKYSKPETKIILFATSEDDGFVIGVKDQGLGIPKDEQKKIFESFQRGSNNIAEGMGLGLYLIKNIVKKHRGTVNLRSKVGKGTTIEIKLPKGKL